MSQVLSEFGHDLMNLTLEYIRLQRSLFSISTVSFTQQRDQIEGPMEISDVSPPKKTPEISPLFCFSVFCHKMNLTSAYSKPTVLFNITTVSSTQQ